MSTQINREQIVSVTVYKKAKARQYSYKPAINKWYFRRKEGFYFWNFSTIDYLPDCLYVDEGIIYHKPHMEIRMSNGQYFEKIFCGCGRVGNLDGRKYRQK